jgi:hypothetical protein
MKKKENPQERGELILKSLKQNKSIKQILSKYPSKGISSEMKDLDRIMRKITPVQNKLKDLKKSGGKLTEKDKEKTIVQTIEFADKFICILGSMYIKQAIEYAELLVKQNNGIIG